MTIIQDGTGSGKEARVDNTNKLEMHGITQFEAAEAVENGDAYNINTGPVTLTSDTASGVIYVKNNENRDLVIDTIAIGVGSAGTTTDVTNITLVRNPTGGTLISGASTVDMNQNRNFGSNSVLIVDAFKGAEGNTVTGGEDIILIFGSSPRTAAIIDLVLPKGSSIAITMDTNTTSGNTIVYAALICHLKRAD